MVILSFDGVFTPVTYLARELVELGRNGNSVANIMVICYAEGRRYEQLDHNEAYEKRSKPPLYGLRAAVRLSMVILICHAKPPCSTSEGWCTGA